MRLFLEWKSRGGVRSLWRQPARQMLDGSGKHVFQHAVPSKILLIIIILFELSCGTWTFVSSASTEVAQCVPGVARERSY